MWCKFPYNENFVVFCKKHVGGNGNLIINFAWPYELCPLKIRIDTNKKNRIKSSTPLDELAVVELFNVQ